MVCYKHGFGRRQDKNPIYRLWGAIKNRCENPNNKDYARYGGRGISVCPEWAADFMVFRTWALANGYRRGLLIDRIDPHGNYEPSNCRFASHRTSSNNKTNNVMVTAFGETKTASEWSRDRRCVISWGLLFKRISRGMNPEDALTIPPDPRKQRGK